MNGLGEGDMRLLTWFFSAWCPHFGATLMTCQRTCGSLAGDPSKHPTFEGHLWTRGGNGRQWNHPGRDDEPSCLWPSLLGDVDQWWWWLPITEWLLLWTAQYGCGWSWAGGTWRLPWVLHWVQTHPSFEGWMYAGCKLRRIGGKEGVWVSMRCKDPCEVLDGTSIFILQSLARWLVLRSSCYEVLHWDNGSKTTCYRVSPKHTVA